MHLTEVQSLEKNWENATASETYQGSFNELYDFLNGIDMSSRAQDGGIYTSGRLTRRPAGRGQLELSAKLVFEGSVWSFDFSEISKPIKTWLALKITDQTQLANELNKLDLWEQQKQNGGQGTVNYLNFRYDNTNALTGFTLAVAQKIHKGIDTYSIYMPVATCTRSQDRPFTDNLNSIGTWTSRLVSPTDPIPSNVGQLQAFSGLRPYWLKTADSISTASDGILTRRESWTGLDDLDKDLYRGA